MENARTHALEEVRNAEAASSPGREELVGKQEAYEEGVTEQLSPAQLKEAGWSYIYLVATGQRSLVNNNWLPIKLEHRDANGNYIWTTKRPDPPPRKGTTKCLLHPDDENRKKYDEMGFPVCKKSNMPNQYQQRNHMRKRHKAEYAIIQEMEADKKEAIRVEKEAAMMEALTGKKEEAPLYVSPNPKPRRKRNANV